MVFIIVAAVLAPLVIVFWGLVIVPTWMVLDSYLRATAGRSEESPE